MKTLTYQGITADAALWQKLGMREYTNTPFSEQPLTETYAPSDGDLIEARLASGSTGDAALVWLIQERRRQGEHAAALRAQKQAGDDAIHAARGGIL